MREYKFRGKRKDNGEWVYGDLLHGQGKTFIAIGVSYITHANHVYVVPNDWYEVDPDTVGQYTEIPDKNGKEIYENDILQNPMVLDKWLVEYIDGCYYACLIPNSGIIAHSKDAKYPHHKVILYEVAEAFEVIGNVFEDGDLIDN